MTSTSIRNWLRQADLAGGRRKDGLTRDEKSELAKLRKANAMCESFFATLERELLQRRKFQTQAEALMVLFHYIEAWYNPRRRHSALDYQSPVSYESKYLAAA